MNHMVVMRVSPFAGLLAAVLFFPGMGLLLGEEATGPSESSHTVIPVVDPEDDNPVGSAEAASPSSMSKGKIDHENVPYDDHEATTFHFWAAKGDTPRPLVVFIHGGGWLRGQKQGGNSLVRSLLDDGISVASIGYRFAPEHPLPVPVYDAARAIQSLRSKATALNIDKDRIAAWGSSAGGATAMWLLFHDDLAVPDSMDPVLRESSRISAAVAGNGQTSIDPKFIEPLLGKYGIAHPMIHKSVGAEDLESALANYETYADLYRKFSAINHVSRGDPPLFMTYSREMILPPENSGDGIHHPLFGVKMQEACDAAGVECHLIIAGEASPQRYQDGREFLVDKLLGDSE